MHVTLQSQGHHHELHKVTRNKKGVRSHEKHGHMDESDLQDLPVEFFALFTSGTSRRRLDQPWHRKLLLVLQSPQTPLPPATAPAPAAAAAASAAAPAPRAAPAPPAAAAAAAAKVPTLWQHPAKPRRSSMDFTNSSGIGRIFSHASRLSLNAQLRGELLTIMTRQEKREEAMQISQLRGMFVKRWEGCLGRQALLKAEGRCCSSATWHPGRP